MHIGFYMKWEKGLSSQPRRNVIGEEYYIEAMCRCLRELSGVESAELYAPNHLPEKKIDVMVHLNDTAPMGVADRNVLYPQNGHAQGSDVALEELTKNGYDGYILLSEKLINVHRSKGFDGAHIPYGADIELFYPRDKDLSLECDVSYAGNDIKGKERTERYLLPATRFNLGLYGNWAIGNPVRNDILSRFGLSPYERYRITLSKMSRGNISPERLPMLYSSSRINLNVTQQDAVDWDFWILRPLEVMACGGFLISDRIPCLEREFAGGAVFTDGGEGLVKNIEYYLDNEDERERIARRGIEIVRERHSIKDRARDLYEYLRRL